MPHETVLIIEDDPTLLRGLRDNFESAGFGVQTAVDGEAGLEARHEARPKGSQEARGSGCGEAEVCAQARPAQARDRRQPGCPAA